jgi:protein-S-isoprenylcysteine O-methyltransferase Ste14
MSIYKAKNGMNLVGQGAKIIMVSLPALAAAILCDWYFPDLILMPSSLMILIPLGYVLLSLGILLWAVALIQLLLLFPKGKLVTSGAYSICRNPIYSSCIFFVFPALALITMNSLYFLVSLCLLVGVCLFIGKEEKKLTSVFGKEYTEYTQRVGRIVPFIRPVSKT